MYFGLNWVDFIIIIVLGFFVIGAIGRPLLFELFDLVGIFAAAVISFTFYNIPAKYLESEFLIPHSLSLVLGFMSAWFLTEVIFYIIIRLILPRLPQSNLPFTRSLSVFPALLRGLIVIAIALVVVATFPIQPSVKKAVINSKLAPPILRRAYGLEAPVKNVFGGLSNDSLAFMTVKPKSTEKINLGFQTNEFTTDFEAEEKMVEMVNGTRRLFGVEALVPDERLRGVARGYSADMLRRGYFSHYSPEGHSVKDRTLDAEVEFSVVGENLAYAPNVEAAFRGFMNSEGHRKNILNPEYRRIGIGAMDAGVYGKMFTQVFSD